eukprot:c31263_g1_i1 orf=337-570(-)
MHALSTHRRLSDCGGFKETQGRREQGEDVGDSQQLTDLQKHPNPYDQRLRQDETLPAFFHATKFSSRLHIVGRYMTD